MGPSWKKVQYHANTSEQREMTTTWSYLQRSSLMNWQDIHHGIDPLVNQRQLTLDQEIDVALHSRRLAARDSLVNDVEHPG